MENNEGSNIIETNIAAALDGIIEIRLALRDEADAIAQEYWDHHFAHNPKLSLKDKTPMGVRVFRQTANPTHFSIMWFWNKWILNKRGKKQIITTYIPKGQTRITYSTKRLLHRAKDWEADLIVELEQRFALIRRDIREINKSESALKRLLKNRTADAEKARQEAASQVEEDDA